MIHPYDNIDVIHGAATSALELVEEVEDLDIVIAPVGGILLFSFQQTVATFTLNKRWRFVVWNKSCMQRKEERDSCVWCRAQKVCSPRFISFSLANALFRVDDAYRSFHSGKIEDNEDISTIADGLRTSLSDITLYLIRKYCDGIVLVEEEEILHAMKLMWERMKIVVEPSGAVPLAALMRLAREKPELKGKKVGIIISGGNVDASVFFDKLGDQVEKNKRTQSKL